MRPLPLLAPRHRGAVRREGGADASASSGQIRCQSSRKSWRVTLPPVARSMSTQRVGEIEDVPDANCERYEIDISNNLASCEAPPRSSVDKYSFNFMMVFAV